MKKLSLFDKISGILVVGTLTIWGLFSLWDDNYWLLKGWFTYRVINAATGYITNVIKAKPTNDERKKNS